MCGIAGFFNVSSRHKNEEDLRLLKGMCDKISHRGPDANGYWSNDESNIFLGHRRLSILDLTEAGSQPMLSPNSRYAIIFNGEIYNHLQIRKEIIDSGKSPIWKGHSDTETLLVGFELWGIQKTIEKCTGMFAFAIWCIKEKELVLGRDRVGEKPLYFGWQNNSDSSNIYGKTFLFASELKALQMHPAFEGKINRNVLPLYLRHNYIPHPYSIYEGISKLTPGSLLFLSLADTSPKIVSYWSAENRVKESLGSPFQGNENEAIDHLEKLLKKAIGQQMIADVPLGAFLSGGVDSSTIVALMQSQSPRPIKTFSIGFHEDGYNEAIYAKEVANYLKTEHTELYVTHNEAIDVIPSIPTLYDEPFSDSSQIPTFLVSKMAKNHVTVSLSGDAGDELFSGYNRYLFTNNLWGKISVIPTFLRKLTANGIKKISPEAWNKLASLFLNNSYSNIGDKIHKGASILTSESIDELYLKTISHWIDSTNVVIDATEPITLLNSSSVDLGFSNSIQKMMFKDFITYLPDDILVKVDRAAMGVSLETRVPFLDHEIIEFAWSLPQSMKIRDKKTKWILRQVLHRYVPESLIERPKMGFGIPIDKWLRGPLREWAESLMSESKIKNQGFFNYQAINSKWEEHLKGKRNWSYHIWDVLMFQAWLEKQPF